MSSLSTPTGENPSGEGQTGENPSGEGQTGEDVLPRAYPARWEADVVLSDGSTVQVRPIRPEDGRRIEEFHARQSPESIYFRYFSPRPELSASDIEHLTHLDYEDRIAFVALRGDHLVGTARYDRWPTRSEAEVAFFVDDAHRGRGLATVLLEYLAAAARGAGISSFTATVLPTNRRMVGVFARAGFTVSSTFEDGVIEVRLDLQPTPEAEAAIEARASSAEAEAVRLLLAPRSVAVIGASRRRGSIGHEVFRNLLRHEFAGPVYPVNRSVEHVAGVRAVPSVEEIDGPLDLAVVAVPADEVPEVIEQCGQRGVRAVIVLSAGFAESGPEGAARSAKALRVARRFGIRLLGPNCLGVISTDSEVRLHATFATPEPRPGTVALLSESGTIGGVILDHMGQVGLGLSSFAAIGNRADVSANDLLQFWEEDQRTEIVLLYLESFGNPRKFGRLARSLARSKPVVAVKSGRAARAYPGEDVSLSSATVDALLRQTGMIRVDTLAQSLDVARVLAGSPQLPAGPRVAVVGNAGGTLVAAADACVDAGLELAPVSGEAATGHSSWPTKLRDNPLDLGFEAGPDDLEWVLGHLLADEQVDSALVMCAPSAPDQTDQFGRAIQNAHAAAPDKPVVACMFGPHAPVIGAPERGGTRVPVFDFPDAAAYALGQVTRYAAWRAEPEGRFVEPDGVDPARVRAAAADALAVNGEGWLAPEPTTEVLRSVGLEPVAMRTAETIDGAAVVAEQLTYPVAVKAAGRDRHARSEAAGLALDVQGEADLRATCGRIAAQLGERAFPFLIQRMAEPGIDVAVGVAQSPLVGPVLTVGAGGAATAMAVPRLRVLPLTDRDARRCVAESDIAALLDEGGRKALEDLVLRVGALVEAAPELAELELNPVIIAPGARDLSPSVPGAAIAEARLRVAPVERDPLPPVRRV